MSVFDFGWIHKWLDSLKLKCFYGHIELVFQNGNVVNIKKHESISADKLE
jgi:hypothetical protein